MAASRKRLVAHVAGERPLFRVERPLVTRSVTAVVERESACVAAVPLLA